MDDGKRRSAAAALSDSFLADRLDLWSFARRRLGDDSLADEVVQETFLRAWRSMHRYDADLGTPRMWLFGICRHAVADVRRRRMREVSVACWAYACHVVDEQLDDPVERDVVRCCAARALSAMTPKQRDAVSQVILSQRPYAVAAAALGVPVGTVKSRVNKGLTNARRAAA
jgi:RNA polymerase sigma-70 factor (ECF subfamily)